MSVLFSDYYRVRKSAAENVGSLFGEKMIMIAEFYYDQFTKVNQATLCLIGHGIDDPYPFSPPFASDNQMGSATQAAKEIIQEEVLYF